jgi:hypothetical protein
VGGHNDQITADIANVAYDFLVDAASAHCLPQAQLAGYIRLDQVRKPLSRIVHELLLVVLGYELGHNGHFQQLVRYDRQHVELRPGVATVVDSDRKNLVPRAFFFEVNRYDDFLEHPVLLLR